MTVRIGSHVERTDPLEGARVRGAEVIQINLSAPQTWRAPSVKPDEPQLAASGLPIWVHAPYLVNPASVNAEQRAKSRRCLIEQTDAAARVGARGLVVHGGHPTGTGTTADGIDGWLEVLEGWTPAVPICIENTAGGSAAVARHLDALARLFDALRVAGHAPGFVLDTCHAHAGGMAPDDLVTAVLAATGRIDLVHLNDSKDPAGSGRDRHEHLGAGRCDPAWLVDVVRAADTDTVVETPDGPLEQAADMAWIRERLAR
jgi:deoxyribonuclease-4